MSDRLPTGKPSGSEGAAAWVEALRARGVTLRARGKNLAMMPKHAYGEMSADERKTLKLHKAAIVAIVQGETHAPAAPEPKAAPRVKQPEPCQFCGRACCGPDHPAYETMHYNDPAEVKRRDEHATKVMLARIG